LIQNSARGSNTNGNTSNGVSNGFSNGRSNNTFTRRDREKEKIYLSGNLTFDTTESDVKEFLSKNDISGDLEVRIAVDKDTGNSKGFGFVSVYDDQLFDKVLKCNGKKLNNRVLRINSANK
jgi:RNA recognition motif-containing protein